MTKPLVSIVMPSLSQARFLTEALDSVLGQDYAHLELIVADGGSTDGTVDILSRRSAADERLRWSSEPDTGPPQALNRAMAKVRGTLIGWLNADDLYVPGAIRRAVEAFEAHRDWIMLYGHGEHVDEAGRPIGRYPTLPPDGPLSRFADGCFICQPTVFYRTTMPLQLGPLDERLSASFDFDWWLRAFRAFPERIGFVNAMQAHSRLHASAITARLRRVVAMEGMEVLSRNFGTAPIHWLTTYMEEIARAPAEDRPPNLGAHFLETLAEAAQWLTIEDTAAFRESIKRQFAS